MYKDYRYINAGENEIYRYGHKAQERVQQYLQPNDKGFYSIPSDGGKYWTIGTSEGKYGEFAKIGDKFLSVNKAGFVWAKVGTDKEAVFIEMVNKLLQSMIDTNNSRFIEEEEED